MSDEHHFRWCTQKSFFSFLSLHFLLFMYFTGLTIFPSLCNAFRSPASQKTVNHLSSETFPLSLGNLQNRAHSGCQFYTWYLRKQTWDPESYRKKSCQRRLSEKISLTDVESRTGQKKALNCDGLSWSYRKLQGSGWLCIVVPNLGKGWVIVPHPQQAVLE